LLKNENNIGLNEAHKLIFDKSKLFFV
jgi:hypothetical protein